MAGHRRDGGVAPRPLRRQPEGHAGAVGKAGDVDPPRVHGGVRAHRVQHRVEEANVVALRLVGDQLRRAVVPHLRVIDEVRRLRQVGPQPVGDRHEKALAVGLVGPAGVAERPGGGGARAVQQHHQRQRGAVVAPRRPVDQEAARPAVVTQAQRRLIQLWPTHQRLPHARFNSLHSAL